MGYAITWIAFPETHTADVFRRLDLIPTGATEESPTSLISSAMMPGGWRVLYYNECGCPFLNRDTLSALSQECDVIHCTVEEHCMDSSAALWRDGKRVWHLHHDGSGGPEGWDAEGDLPGCLAEIRSRLEQEQAEAGGSAAEVDFLFDIPLATAQRITGFKHDEEPQHGGCYRFQVLMRSGENPGTPRGKRHWFRALFGK